MSIDIACMSKHEWCVSRNVTKLWLPCLRIDLSIHACRPIAHACHNNCHNNLYHSPGYQRQAGRYVCRCWVHIFNISVLMWIRSPTVLVPRPTSFFLGRGLRGRSGYENITNMHPHHSTCILFFTSIFFSWLQSANTFHTHGEVRWSESLIVWSLLLRNFPLVKTPGFSGKRPFGWRPFWLLF